MKLHQTAKALVARGIASDTAILLANQGLTLAKLKQMTKPQLAALNLSEDFIKNIQSESRPPIDSETLDELLFESRFCCCVCRDSSKPIVIHHIDPWEKSHSHKKENLVVLCPIHHDEAHAKHELTLSLTPARLRSIKEQWLQEVQMLDRNTILSLSDKDFACWDFFNLNRIFELSSKLDIRYDAIPTYQYLFYYGYIDCKGHITPNDCWPHKPMHYWLDMMEGIYLSSYMRDIFVEMIPFLPFKILNYLWKKSTIRSQCKPGDFVVLQGAFYFKDSDTKKKDLRFGYRRAQGIQLEFLYDAWYCTSFSSKYDHLVGRRVATVFAIIREILEDSENDILRIKCSVLAIGSYFNCIYDGRFFINELTYDGDEDEYF